MVDPQTRAVAPTSSTFGWSNRSPPARELMFWSVPSSPAEVTQIAGPEREWAGLWGGEPAGPYTDGWRELRDGFQSLAGRISVVDESDAFGHLVSSNENRLKPVHRWFNYK